MSVPAVMVIEALTGEGEHGYTKHRISEHQRPTRH